jgi:hypothetical protein
MLKKALVETWDDLALLFAPELTTTELLLSMLGVALVMLIEMIFGITAIAVLVTLLKSALML